MKRALLVIAVAAGAAFAAAPAQAAVTYCGDTFLPPCEYCVQPDWTFGPICQSIEIGPAGS